VREWAELLLKDGHRHGRIDGIDFWEEMKSSLQMIESVIRNKASMAIRMLQPNGISL